ITHPDRLERAGRHAAVVTNEVCAKTYRARRERPLPPCGGPCGGDSRAWRACEPGGAREGFNVRLAGGRSVTVETMEVYLSPPASHARGEADRTAARGG